MLEVIDEAIPVELGDRLFEWVKSVPLDKWHAVSARPDVPDVGWQVNLTKTLREELLAHLKPHLDGYKIDRVHIIKQTPDHGMNYWHIDDDSDQAITFLLYLTERYDLDEHGYTLFNVNGKGDIRATFPLPRRAVKFTSTMSHCATPFRTHTRYTLAIKGR